jgi:hypothetical protein
MVFRDKPWSLSSKDRRVIRAASQVPKSLNAMSHHFAEMRTDESLSHSEVRFKDSLIGSQILR